MNSSSKVNLGKTEEARDRKRRLEETQKNARAKSSKHQENPKSNSKNEKKTAPNSPNSANKAGLSRGELSSEDGTVKSNNQKKKKAKKRPKADQTTSDTISSRKLSATTASQLLVEEKLSLQEDGPRKNKPKDENGSSKNAKKLQSSITTQQERVEAVNPFSEKTKSLKGISQNQNEKQKAHRQSSSSPNGVPAKASRTQKQVGTPKIQKASQSKTATSSADKSEEQSARRLKVMRILGLVAPAGSPFHLSRHAPSKRN